MAQRRKHRDHASTPTGKAFRAGFKPVRAFFNKMSRRAESTFWKLSHGGEAKSKPNRK